MFGWTSDKIIVRLRTGQVVTFGEQMSESGRIGEGEYFGKFLRSDRLKKDNMIFGVCVDKGVELEYRENSEVLVSYISSNLKHNFKISVIGARPADPKNKADRFEFERYNDVDKYILTAKAISQAEAASRREFFRMPIQMEIYFKEISHEYLGEISDADLKFEIESARAHKEDADKGVLEEKAGYLKLVTMDVSAGGFMFKSDVRFEPETYIECMLIVDKEALPVVARIVQSRADDILDGHFVHAAFVKISDPVRDRLVKYLIALQQKQRQAFLARRRDRE